MCMGLPGDLMLGDTPLFLCHLWDLLAIDSIANEVAVEQDDLRYYLGLLHHLQTDHPIHQGL